MLLKAQEENAEIIEKVVALASKQGAEGKNSGRDVHPPILQPG